MGALPNVYPGYQKVSIPEVYNKFEELWKTELSHDVGLTISEMIEKCGNELKCL